MNVKPSLAQLRRLIRALDGDKAESALAHLLSELVTARAVRSVLGSGTPVSAAEIRQQWRKQLAKEIARQEATVNHISVSRPRAKKLLRRDPVVQKLHRPEPELHASLFAPSRKTEDLAAIDALRSSFHIGKAPSASVRALIQRPVPENVKAVSRGLDALLDGVEGPLPWKLRQFVRIGDDYVRRGGKNIKRLAKQNKISESTFYRGVRYLKQLGANKVVQ